MRERPPHWPTDRPQVVAHRGASDEVAEHTLGAYLEALDGSLDALWRRTTPGLVFYLAGADPHEGDRLGRLKLTSAGLAERDRRVKTVVLTPHGEAVRGELRRRAGTPPPEIARLSEADAQTLREILQRALDGG